MKNHHESMCRCQLVCDIVDEDCRFKLEDMNNNCIWLSGNRCTNTKANCEALLDKLFFLCESLHATVEENTMEKMEG